MIAYDITLWWIKISILSRRLNMYQTLPCASAIRPNGRKTPAIFVNFVYNSRHFLVKIPHVSPSPARHMWLCRGPESATDIRHYSWHSLLGHAVTWASEWPAFHSNGWDVVCLINNHPGHRVLYRLESLKKTVSDAAQHGVAVIN